MVGIVRDIVIPLEKGSTANANPVFTIVCEILTTPAPHESYSNNEEETESKHVTRLWKMASAWRVISFFLVVFVLPTVLISLPLYARYHLYHARHIPMTETDTRALNHAVSSFWCQGQRVTSNGTLDAYKVAGAPRVQRQRRHVSLQRNLTLRHDDIEYWGVYLLEGSTFSLSSCARWPGGTMLVVRGEDNLRKCFYREDKVKDQLNGEPSPAVPNIRKAILDMENDDDDDDDDNEGVAKIKPTFVKEEEDGGIGGEVFDEDDDDDEDLDTQISELKFKMKSQEIVKQDDGDLVPLLIEGIKVQQHGDILQKKSNPKQRGERRRNKKGKNKKERKNKKRSRSELIERIRRDANNRRTASRSTVTEDSIAAEFSEKLSLLHKYNDTLEVTSGNSSISSSEEFLEQCKDTILTVDLTPTPDWALRVLDFNNNPDSWHITINTSDYYYFIFTSDNNIELNKLGFNLQLQRATYDVSSAIEICQNSTECIFPLAFTQTESVVVEVPAGETLSELHSFEITTTCQPRVPVYMVFILLVPFIILLFAFQ